MQAGTVLSEDAFIVRFEDAADTLKIIESQAAEIETLRMLINEQDERIERLLFAYRELNEARLVERDEWQARLQKAAATIARLERKRWAFGFQGGYGNQGGHVGIGITYALWLW